MLQSFKNLNHKCKDTVSFFVGVLFGFAVLFLPSIIFAAPADFGLSDLAGLGLGTVTDVKMLAVNLIRLALGFLGIVAIIIVLYGGFVWMTAGGNLQKIDRAKKILINGLIGLAIILSAFAIVSFIIWQFLKVITPGGGPCDPIGAIRSCNSGCGDQTCIDDGSGVTGTWGACMPIPGLCVPPIPGELVVSSYSPIDPPPPPPLNGFARNIDVVVTFSEAVDSTTVVYDNPIDSGSVRIYETSDATKTPVDVTLDSSQVADPRRRFITLTSNILCPIPNDTDTCFKDNTQFTIELDKTVLPGMPLTIKNASGSKTLTCPLGKPCNATFTIGDFIDTSNPTVQILQPSNGAAIGSINFTARANDNYALRKIDYFDITPSICLGGANAPNACTLPADCPGGVCTARTCVGGANAGAVCTKQFDCPGGQCGQMIGTVPAVGPNWRSLTGTVQWDTSSYKLGSRRTIESVATDLVTLQGRDERSIVFRPDHCYNGVLDGGETGLDCGGDPSDPLNYCGGCPGDPCDTDPDPGICSADNNLCAPFSACDQTSCVCLAPPVIYNVQLPDGAPGNFITISGRGFGANPGTVTFLGPDPNDPSDDLTAVLPPVCGAAVWRDDQIIVEVPYFNNPPLSLTLPMDSHIEVKTAAAAGGLSDRTDQPPGPSLPAFEVNTTVRPGLCAVTPNSGKLADPVTYTGVRFGAAQGKALIGGVAGPVSTWTAGSVDAAVPNIRDGRYGAQIEDNAAPPQKSNPVDFTVLPLTPDPRIDLIQPDNGPVEQVITIFGANFGNEEGTVHFIDSVTGDKIGIVPEPAQCAALGGLWRDKQIVVKVPTSLTLPLPLPAPLPASVLVYVKRPDTKESNRDKTYQVNRNPIAPGLYCLNPNNGPVGTRAQIIGEKLRNNTEAQVRFYDDKLASVVDNNDNPPGLWTGDKIEYAKVPVGAETGPLRVNLTAIRTCVGGSDRGKLCNNLPADCPGGSCELLASNGLNFRVGACTSDSSCDLLGGEECCDSICRPAGTCAAPTLPTGSYRWQFTTGNPAPRVVESPGCTLATQSPSPWKESTDACTDAGINVRFTTDLDPSVCSNAGAIELRQCENQSCATFAGGPLVLNNLPCPTNDNLVRQPQAPLIADTWYQGRVVASVVESDQNIFMRSDYFWKFHTSDQPCEVRSTFCAANPSALTNIGQTSALTALRQAQNCNILVGCVAGDITWSNIEPAVLSLTTNGPGACVNSAAALAEDSSPPAEVWAQAVVNGADQGTPGICRINVRLEDLMVVKRYPDCQAACLNARIGATFNIDVLAASLAGNVSLDSCDDDICTTPTPVPSTASLVAPKELTIQPSASLNVDRYYRVTIVGGPGGIRSTTGKPLSNADPVTGLYQWMFKTGIKTCEVDRLDLNPKNATVRTIGATQSYFAQPYSPPDACSASGQALNPLYSDYDWSSANQQVATISSDRGRLPPITATTCSNDRSRICSAPSDCPGGVCDVAPGVNNFVKPNQTATAVGQDPVCSAAPKFACTTAIASETPTMQFTAYPGARNVNDTANFTLQCGFKAGAKCDSKNVTDAAGASICSNDYAKSCSKDTDCGAGRCLNGDTNCDSKLSGADYLALRDRIASGPAVVDVSAGDCANLDVDKNGTIQNADLSPLDAMFKKAFNKFPQNSCTNNVNAAASAVFAKTAEIIGGPVPTAVAFSSDGLFAYVTNQGVGAAGNSISVIDVLSNKIIKTISGLYTPMGIALHPTRPVAYVANRGAAPGGQYLVSVINTTSNAVSGAIPLNSPAEDVAFTPAGDLAYVSNGNNVTVIDTASQAIVATISGFSTPTGITTITKDGKVFAYVSNAAPALGTVSVIDTDTNTIVDLDPVTPGIQNITVVGNSPRGSALGPDNKTLWVTNRGSSRISFINTSSNSWEGNLNVGGTSQDIAIRGQLAYVTVFQNNTVRIIDTNTRWFVGSAIPVQTEPYGIAIAPSGSVYVASLGVVTPPLPAPQYYVVGVIENIGTCTADNQCNTGAADPTLCGQGNPDGRCTAVGTCLNDSAVPCLNAQGTPEDKFCKFAVNKVGCCGARPWVENVAFARSPQDNRICPNSAFEVTFNTVMNSGTINSDSVQIQRFKQADADGDCNTLAKADDIRWWQKAWRFVVGLFSGKAYAAVDIWCKVDAAVSIRQAVDSLTQLPLSKTMAVISPKELLTSGVDYRVFVRGEPKGGGTGGVASAAGVQLQEPYGPPVGPRSDGNGNYIYNLIPTASPPSISPLPCAIDRVEVKIDPPLSEEMQASNPRTDARPYDLFSCYGDDCNCKKGPLPAARKSCRVIAGGQEFDEDQRPGVGVNAGNQHIYTAEAKTVNGATLSATYQWIDNDPQSVLMPPTESGLSNEFLTVTDENKNGLANVVVTATSGTSAKSQTVPVTVYLCSNPWNNSLQDGPGDSDNNFRATYCRDNKGALLPDLNRLRVANPPPNSGIRREWILKDPNSPDAIGVRVVNNSRHVTPEQWYSEQRFPKGSPQSLVVDGYPAVRDGRTVYIGAGNAVGTAGTASGLLYTNIYVFSYNQGAKKEIINIFNQLINNVTFNINKLSAGQCHKLDGTALDKSCLVNSDCQSEEYCGNTKSGIARDVKRLSDTMDVSALAADYRYGTDCPRVTVGAPGDADCNGVINAQDLLKTWGYANNRPQYTAAEAAICSGADYNFNNSVGTDDYDSVKNIVLTQCKGGKGLYPGLGAGTYVQGTSTSRWPSWEDNLSKELGKKAPVDPLNFFAACPSFDSDTPNTCWNDKTKQYACQGTPAICRDATPAYPPAIPWSSGPPANVSQVYTYTGYGTCARDQTPRNSGDALLRCVNDSECVNPPGFSGDYGPCERRGTDYAFCSFLESCFTPTPEILNEDTDARRFCQVSSDEMSRQNKWPSPAPGAGVACLTGQGIVPPPPPPPTQQMTLEIEGSGEVDVEASPIGTCLPSVPVPDCKYSIIPGKLVKLTARPDNSSDSPLWIDGPCKGSRNTVCTFVMPTTLLNNQPKVKFAPPPPVINEFKSDKAFIVSPPAVPVLLSWNVSNATHITIERTSGGLPIGGLPIYDSNIPPGSLIGSASATSGVTLDYRLTATNTSGSASQTITVTVYPAITVTFEVRDLPTGTFGPTATIIVGGAGAELRWNVSNATSVTIDGTAVANPSGQMTVSPDSPTTYVLNAIHGPSGQDVTSTVTVDVNRRPIAEAGPPQTVNENTTVTHDGSGSSDPDGDPLTYSWSLSSCTGISPCPTLAALSFSSATAQKPTFTAPTVGPGGATLTFQLIVNDGSSDSAPDTVDIKINNINQPPIAEAGPPQTVNENTTVTHDGSASSDPDGDPITYSWSLSGCTILSPCPTLASLGFSSTTAQKPTFTAPSVGPGGATLTFQLIVNDGSSNSAPDTVVITVTNINQAPTANAGPDQTVNEGVGVTLNGRLSSDPDDCAGGDNGPAPPAGTCLTYAWTQTAGTIVTLSSSISSQPTFTAPSVGAGGVTLTFSLTVTDKSTPPLSDATPDTVDIKVNNINQAPVANAGPDQTTVNEGDTVTLNGRLSYDPDDCAGGDNGPAPPAGTCLTYAWTQTAGTIVTLSSSISSQPTFTAPSVGAGGVTLTFSLTVTDKSTPPLSDATPDTVDIKVNNINQAPSISSSGHSPVPVAILSSITFDAYWSDPDGDQVRLFICKASDATSSGCGVGGTWVSSAFSASSPVTVVYTTVAADCQNAASCVNNHYTYVCDNGTPSLCSAPVASSFTITNSEPETYLDSCPVVKDSANNSVDNCTHKSGDVTAIGGPYNSRANFASFTFTGQDNESGVISALAQFQCKLDGGVWGACPSLVPMYSGLPLGTHTFEVKAKDTSNLFDSTSAKFVWDVVPDRPPIITLQPVTCNAGDSCERNNGGTFVFSATDPDGDAVGFNCKIVNGTLTQTNTCNGGFISYNNLRSGVTTFEVTADDGFGGTDVETYVWTIPTAVIVSGPSGTVFTDTSDFTFRGDDSDAGATINEFRCRIDGNSGDPYTDCNNLPLPPPKLTPPVPPAVPADGTPPSIVSYTSPPLINGPHKLYLKVVDNKGNVSTDTINSSRSWTILVPPAIITQISTFNGDGLDIKLGSNGFARISYINADSNPGELWFTECYDVDCRTMNPEKIDDAYYSNLLATPPEPNRYRTSLALKSDDTPGISYADQNGTLKYAQRVSAGNGNCPHSTNWSCTSLETNVANASYNHSSLQFVRDGPGAEKPVILYNKSGGINKRALYLPDPPVGGLTCLDSNWFCSTLSSPAGYNVHGINTVYDPTTNLISFAYMLQPTVPSWDKFIQIWKCTDRYCLAPQFIARIPGTAHVNSNFPSLTLPIGLVADEVGNYFTLLSYAYQTAYRIFYGSSISSSDDNITTSNTLGYNPIGYPIVRGPDGTGGKINHIVAYNDGFIGGLPKGLLYLTCEDNQACRNIFVNMTIIDQFTVGTTPHVAIASDLAGRPRFIYQAPGGIWYAKCKLALCK